MDVGLHGHVARGAARALVAAAPLAAALAVRGGALPARCEARGRAAVRGLVAAAGASYAGSLAVLHRVSACDASAVLTALLSLASCLLAAQAALAAAARARAPFPRRRLSRGAATTGLLVFGGFWALASTAFIAAASLDAQLTPAGRAARAAAAAACAAAASFTTHGLVGPALQRDWRFVAPFKGGGLAVALQAAAWGVTGAATLAFARLARAGAVATTAAARALLAASPLLAQLLLVASLLAWRKGGATKPGALSRFAGARACARTLPTALLIYAPAHLTAGAAAAVVAAAPVPGSLFLAAFLAIYYAITSRNDALTRGRPWPRFRAAVAARAHAALAAWHGGCRVVWDDLSGGPTWGDGGRQSGRRPSPWAATNRPLLFGYAPHGLYPIGLIALPLLPGFRSVWPRSAPPPVPLVASAVLFSPVLRDIAAWLGARVVSRPSLTRALTVDRAAALVPGGQAELVHAHALHTRRALVIVRKHAGFVRAAVDAGAALVPVLALGEGAALRDGLPMPALKAAAVRALGFPVPFLLAGRGWVTPLPRRGTPLTFVIGPPVTAPAGLTGDAAVRAAHAAFYKTLRSLYEKHAPSVPGYEDVTLEWADDGPAAWQSGADDGPAERQRAG